MPRTIIQTPSIARARPTSSLVSAARTAKIVRAMNRRSSAAQMQYMRRGVASVTGWNSVTSVHCSGGYSRYTAAAATARRVSPSQRRPSQ